MIPEPYGTLIVLIIVIAFICSIAGGAYFLASYLAHRRSTAFKSFALNNGFSFQEKIPKNLLSAKNIEVPKKLNSTGGDSVTNFMERSREGKKEAVFNYRCIVSGGTADYRGTGVAFSQTIFSFECARGTPEFTLEREGTAQKIIGKVGFSQGIKFDSNQDFSKEYVLNGENVVAIKKLFTPTVIKFFENNKLAKGILHNEVVECTGKHFLIYCINTKLKDKAVGQKLSQAQKIMSIFD